MVQSQTNQSQNSKADTKILLRSRCGINEKETAAGTGDLAKKVVENQETDSIIGN